MPAARDPEQRWWDRSAGFRQPESAGRKLQKVSFAEARTEEKKERVSAGARKRVYRLEMRLGVQGNAEFMKRSLGKER